MTLCIAFSVFTFDFVCLALQRVGKHSRKSKDVHSGNLGDVTYNMFYNVLVIASLYNKVEYFVKLNFSSLVIAKTYLDSNYIVSI